MLEGYVIDYCKKEGIIVDATFEITQKCNLKCKHCYIDERAPYLSRDTIFQMLIKLYEEGTINITFTGGEIFSHPHFKEIYLFAKKRGFIIELKTNALLITKEWINLFVEYPPEEINITVYGLDNDDYFHFTGDKFGFDKLKRNLDLLYKKELSFSLHVIATTINYNQIVEGKYHDFFAKYDLEFGYDYDVLDGLNGNTEQLSYRLSPEKIAYIDNKQSSYIDLSQKEYVDRKQKNTSGLECYAGIAKIFISAQGLVSTCSFDRDEKFIFDYTNFEKTKAKLNKRNREIKELYTKSKCCSCKRNFMCRTCPLKANRIDSLGARCELSYQRLEYFQKNTLKYDLVNEHSLLEKYPHLEVKLEFLDYAIDKSELDYGNSYYDQISSPIVEYRVNQQKILGSKGKSFFYIPVNDLKDYEVFQLSSQKSAFKIFRFLSSDNLSDNLQKLKRSIEVNNFLFEKKIAPEFYKIVVLKNKIETRAFFDTKLVIYPENSLFVGIEVEHIQTISFDDNANFFYGNKYSNDILVEEIEKIIEGYNIIYKDLWVGNLLNTKNKGIQLVDFFEWELGY